MEYKHCGSNHPQRKDMSDMSFVGIHNINEGLIAFADSKASKKYNNGEIKEDIERGAIQKIFKNKSFICVSHGNNELFSEYKKMRLEDYFNNHLVENINYMEFFEDLYIKLIADKPEYNNGIYYFIIGGKDENGYFIRNLTINLENEELIYSDKNYHKEVLFGGDKRYVQLYELVPKYYDIAIANYSNMIKTQIEALVQLFDATPLYNSVGLPINIILFQ